MLKTVSRTPNVMLSLALLAALLCIEASDSSAEAPKENPEVSQASPELTVPKCNDFQVTGKGDSPAWKKVPWTKMNVRAPANHPYDAKFKLTYSAKGIYVLFSGTDQKLTATLAEDFLDLWTEDVYECFFWTDEAATVYFEYEISPLGYELPILIPNFNDKFLGWRPWHYEGERKTRKAVSAVGGKSTSMASVNGWSAEVFIPFALLEPLQNVPPKSGSRWRANFYRVDYDNGQQTAWDWARVGESFHEFQRFGTIVFE